MKETTISEAMTKMRPMFSRFMRETAKKLGMEYKEREVTEEEICFSLDRFRFTVHCEEVPFKTLGGERMRNVFILSAWTLAGWTRHTPQELEDTTVCRSHSIHDCIKGAFVRVSSEKIGMVLADVGFTMMYEEFAKSEPGKFFY